MSTSTTEAYAHASAEATIAATTSTTTAEYPLDDGSMFDPMFIPGYLSTFLLTLRQQVFVRNYGGMFSLYEADLPKVVAQVLSNQPWPVPDAVVELFRHSQSHEPATTDTTTAAAVQLSYELTSALYKFLYFRHLCQRGMANVHARFASFQSFIDLFNLLLEQPAGPAPIPIVAADSAAAASAATTDAAASTGTSSSSSSPDAAPAGVILPLVLPHIVCWEMIDEFINQFQEFHSYRHNVKQLSADDIEALRANPQAWQAGTVLRYLHAFARKATIDVSQPFDTKAAEQRVSPLFLYCGQYALVGLVRTHILLSDFESAMAALDPIELRQLRHIHSIVPTCYISLNYHLAVAMLMLRRYTDCIRLLSFFVSYMDRNKHQIQRSPHLPQIEKRFQQTMGLLTLSFALCPEYVEEHVQRELKDKYEEQLARMLKGELGAFREVFLSSTPVPVVTTLPNYDALADSDGAADSSSSSFLYSHGDHRELQWQHVQADISQRLQLPAVIAYLRMFSSISVSRLARFLNMQDEERVMSLLATILQKSRQWVWNTGAVNNSRMAYQPIGAEAKERERNRDGSFSDGIIELVVDRDAITIVQTKSVRRYGDFFIKQTLQFEGVLRDLAALDGGATGGATSGAGAAAVAAQ